MDQPDHSPPPEGEETAESHGDAELQPSGLSCAACAAPIQDLYYEVNEGAMCAPCTEALQAELSRGSRWSRFARAGAFGVLAGALSALIYFAVAALTGYELGLVAIIVGWLVGGAVRFGAYRRGGWFYQALAMFLTYSAIGASYFAFALSSYAPELEPSGMATSQPASAPTTAAVGSNDPDAGGATDPNAEMGPAGVFEGVAWDELSPGEKAGELLAMLVFCVLLVLALPILVGFESPIGLLIVGFAVFEAWRLNKRRAAKISGPYEYDQALYDSPPPASGLTE